MASNTSLIATLKDDRYTGENRCMRCTYVNITLAAVASVVVAGLTGHVSSWSTSFGVGTIAFVSLCVPIYLNGYLVPGTPTFTKRYLPDTILGWFGKDRAEEQEIDFASALMGAGVLIPCESGEDLCLSPAFERKWQRELSRDAPDGQRFIEGIGASPRDAEFKDRDGPQLHLPETIVHWPSRAAFAADAAAVSVLQGNAWFTSLEPRERAATVERLRLFLEECPSCGGRVALDEERIESCCSERQVFAVSCEKCDVRLAELAADTE